MRFADLAESMPEVAASAEAMGHSLEEALGFVAGATRVGGTVKMTMTDVRNIILRMNSAVEAGIPLQGSLVDKIEQLSEVDPNTLTDLFGDRTVSLLFQAVKQAKMLREEIDLIARTPAGVVREKIGALMSDPMTGRARRLESLEQMRANVPLERAERSGTMDFEVRRRLAELDASLRLPTLLGFLAPAHGMVDQLTGQHKTQGGMMRQMTAALNAGETAFAKDLYRSILALRAMQGDLQGTRTAELGALRERLRFAESMPGRSSRLSEDERLAEMARRDPEAYRAAVQESKRYMGEGPGSAEVLRSEMLVWLGTWEKERERVGSSLRFGFEALGALGGWLGSSAMRVQGEGMGVLNQVGVAMGGFEAALAEREASVSRSVRLQGLELSAERARQAAGLPGAGVGAEAAARQAGLAVEMQRLADERRERLEGASSAGERAELVKLFDLRETLARVRAGGAGGVGGNDAFGGSSRRGVEAVELSERFTGAASRFAGGQEVARAALAAERSAVSSERMESGVSSLVGLVQSVATGDEQSQGRLGELVSLMQTLVRRATGGL